MLGDITIASELYIVCGYTDMRKSIDGLCTIIRDQLHMEPGHSSALYLFCGRRTDRIKGLVWEEDGEIAGYCYAHPWKERAAYHNTLETTVYLSPKHFRKGIGSKLMQQLITHCRADDKKVLIACITANNEASIKMHEALGFKQASYFSKVGEKLGQTLDVIDMQLTL